MKYILKPELLQKYEMKTLYWQIRQTRILTEDQRCLIRQFDFPSVIIYFAVSVAFNSSQFDKYSPAVHQKMKEI